jgi:hypothetical protein
MSVAQFPPFERTKKAGPTRLQKQAIGPAKVAGWAIRGTPLP